MLRNKIVISDNTKKIRHDIRLHHVYTTAHPGTHNIDSQRDLGQEIHALLEPQLIIGVVHGVVKVKMDVLKRCNELILSLVVGPVVE